MPDARRRPVTGHAGRWLVLALVLVLVPLLMMLVGWVIVGA